MRAIFLGSFNPPHKGHVACIEAVINDPIIKDIEKIHVIPCWQNPNKEQQIPFIKRYQMTHFMFDDLIRDGHVVPDDIEEIIKPQYTYDLLNYFHSGYDEYIKDDFWWIITVETINEIIAGKWYKSEEILGNNKFIILYKNGDVLKNIIDLLKKEYIKEAYLVDMSNYCEGKEYHSTELRQKVRNNKSIVTETNERVYEYIKDNNLYSGNV